MKTSLPYSPRYCNTRTDPCSNTPALREDLWIGWGIPLLAGAFSSGWKRIAGQYDEPRDIFWGTGAALLLRRSALDKVGLLDERFEMHMEEIDLCWRLQRAGYRIRVQPASEVYHIGGGSLRRGNPRKVYLTFRNNLLMLYKNLPEPEWKRVLCGTMRTGRGGGDARTCVGTPHRIYSYHASLHRCAPNKRLLDLWHDPTGNAFGNRAAHLQEQYCPPIISCGDAGASTCCRRMPSCNPGAESGINRLAYRSVVYLSPPPLSVCYRNDGLSTLVV